MKSPLIHLRVIATLIFFTLSHSNDIVHTLTNTEILVEKESYDWKDPAYFFQSKKTLMALAPHSEKARLTLIYKNFNGYNRNRYILNISTTEVEKILNIDSNSVIEELCDEALHFILFANLEFSPLQKRAFSIIQERVENKNPKAQYILGELYFEGNLLNQEGEKSSLEIGEKNRICSVLFELAAQQGLVVAQYNYGTLFELGSGYGLKADPVEEYKWVRMAAKNGSAEAQYHIGDMYLWGHESVSQNQLKAIKWYERGARQGDLYCLTELKNLSPILANQISEKIQTSNRT